MTDKKQGIVLLLTVFVIMLMSILVVGYLEIATTETEIMRNHQLSTKAFYIAEGGIQAGIRYVIDNMLSDNNWGNNNGVIYSSVELGSGTYDVELKNGAHDSSDIESVGTFSGFSRTIRQTVTRGGGSGDPEAFEYSMYSFGSTVNFQNSEGTINDADVSTTGQVINEDDITLNNGNFIDGASVAAPTVDFATYESIADNVEAGGFTFTGGNTYGALGSEEIWYVQGNAEIEENVTIYGTVIAENNISFTGSGDKEDVTVNAASGYPALIGGNNIMGSKLKDSAISGLIYAGSNAEFNQADNLTINGTILAGNNIAMKNDQSGSFEINYDQDIIANPPPYLSGGGVSLSAWQESY